MLRSIIFSDIKDFDLFSEVDFVFSQTQRCYMEIDKFWTEEA